MCLHPCRADVDVILSSHGIEPGELAGLELLVTVDVMQKSAELLGSLGLTLKDLAAYHLVLGYSMGKNMVPFIDYLGNIGVRHDALTGGAAGSTATTHSPRDLHALPADEAHNWAFVPSSVELLLVFDAMVNWWVAVPFFVVQL